MNHYTKHEKNVINKYNSFNFSNTIFMNNGYCLLDKQNMPIHSDLILNKKYKKYLYQVNLYDQLLKTANIDFNIKNINLLDIACGRGGGVSFYKDFYKFKNVYGLDINNNHIKICKSHCKNVNFINSSATKIPIKNNKIDIITCLEAEAYFQPFENYCAEAHRILKKEGVLIQASSLIRNFKPILEKYFNIKIIKDINLNVSIGCAISKFLFKDNVDLFNVLWNDEKRYIFKECHYEIYVMNKK
jgi:SAM-dependent methyltransferase